MGLTVEQQVGRFVRAANRPFSLQVLLDEHQKYAIKKAQMQKALDALVAKGELTTKEFGKSRLYWPCQDKLPTLSKEELEAKQGELEAMEEERLALDRKVSALKAEKSALESVPSLEDIEEQLATTADEIQAMESRIAELEASNTTGLSLEDQKQCELAFEVYVTAWRKRRGIFRACWDTISENLPGKTADLYEEIGIETDEDAGVDLKAASELLRPAVVASSSKRRRA